MAKTVAERQRDRRKRLKAQGSKRLTFVFTPKAIEHLRELQEQHPGISQAKIIEMALAEYAGHDTGNITLDTLKQELDEVKRVVRESSHLQPVHDDGNSTVVELRKEIVDIKMEVRKVMESAGNVTGHATIAELRQELAGAKAEIMEAFSRLAGNMPGIITGEQIKEIRQGESETEAKLPGNASGNASGDKHKVESTRSRKTVTIAPRSSTPIATEQEQLDRTRKIWELRDQGLNYPQIAERMNEMKIPTLTNKGKWGKSIVWRILQKERPD